MFLIAGPCVIESEAHALRHAKKIARIAGRLKIPYVYKSSYDKANRTALKSFRGVGLERSLSVLARVKEETGLRGLTDVPPPEEADRAARVVDVLQIPAFLCRQTDLLLAAARTGRTVNVKKGQFLAPWDMKNIVDKIVSTGNKKLWLTERGTSFGYNTLVNDFRGVPVMKAYGFPVVFDATHSVQPPGGLGRATGGDRRFVPGRALAAVAAGADGLFLEVHENPDKAPSDGHNMVRLKDLEEILERALAIHKAIGRRPARKH